MKLINIENVEYCQLTRQIEGEEESLEGIIYQEKTFIMIASYGKNQGQEAIKKARAEFLRHKGLILHLVVEDPLGFTVWIQDDDVKLFQNEPPEEETNFIDEIDLEKLVADMRNIGGISIKNRRYNFRIYNQCFIGYEVVDWLVKHFEISREEAVTIGQKLLLAKWIHHVVDDHPFLDDKLFYRFYWDEK